MEQPNINEFIESEIVKVKEDIERLRASTKPISPSNALGRLTRMDSMNDHGVRKASLLKAEERLYKLEETRTRATQPGFGVCIKCKRPIPVERLMIVPESQLCVGCMKR